MFLLAHDKLVIAQALAYGSYQFLPGDLITPTASTSFTSGVLWGPIIRIQYKQLNVIVAAFFALLRQ